MEVVKNGSTFYDINSVCDKWIQDFSRLYQWTIQKVMITNSTNLLKTGDKQSH